MPDQSDPLCAGGHGRERGQPAETFPPTIQHFTRSAHLIHYTRSGIPLLGRGRLRLGRAFTFLLLAWAGRLQHFAHLRKKTPFCRQRRPRDRRPETGRGCFVAQSLDLLSRSMQALFPRRPHCVRPCQWAMVAGESSSLSESECHNTTSGPNEARCPLASSRPERARSDEARRRRSGGIFGTVADRLQSQSCSLMPRQGPRPTEAERHPPCFVAPPSRVNRPAGQAQ